MKLRKLLIPLGVAILLSLVAYGILFTMEQKSSSTDPVIFESESVRVDCPPGEQCVSRVTLYESGRGIFHDLGERTVYLRESDGNFLGRAKELIAKAAAGTCEAPGIAPNPEFRKKFRVTSNGKTREFDNTQECYKEMSEVQSYLGISVE